MKWTNEAPKKPGFYYWQGGKLIGKEVAVVQVTAFVDKSRPLQAEELCLTRSSGMAFKNAPLTGPAEAWGGKWAGPLPEPEEANAVGDGTPSPERLGSLSACPACGEVPDIDGDYRENKKMAFSTLRLLHFCRKSPIVTKINARVFDKPGTWTESELRRMITEKWNCGCLANTGCQVRREMEEDHGKQHTTERSDGGHAVT